MGHSENRNEYGPEIELTDEEKHKEHDRIVGNDIVTFAEAGKLLGMTDEEWEKIGNSGYFEYFPLKTH